MSFQTFLKITDDLKNDYPQNPAWENSSFNWIRCLPPGSKGAIGRAAGSALLNNYGFTAMARRNQLRVNGQNIEVRIALMWEEGNLKFQNIRDIKFDHVLCFGVCPDKVFAWLVPKSEVWKDGKINTDNRGVTPQHKGADAWVGIDLNNVQPWLQPYGGTLEEMIAVAKTAL